jgi:CBS domain-containing protein
LSSRSSSPSVVSETVIEFLKTVPPFQFLPPNELSRLVSSMTLEYFPKDDTIIRAGHRASEVLYIVHKGAVQLALRTKVGKELVFDVRSEGEIFGLLSLMGRDIARLDVTAVEDALCYSIPGTVIQELGSRYPEFSEYLVRVSITRYLDRTLKELKDQTNLMGSTERLLYSLAVNDVVSAPAIVCAGETSIREAAKLASTSCATCLAVVGPDGRAIGIVTDRDFTRRVLADGVSLDLPVASIMSTPVVSVESTARLFQALLAMISKDIHHVLVVEEGLPKSVLSSHDLILLQGKSPLTVSRHIEQQKSVEGLAAAQKKIMEMIPLLLREGARVSHITRVVSEINDRLMAKILEFAEAELGPPPLPYCWVVLGSEGRREQTFKTDQDNALIFADADANADASNAATAQEYFARFSQYVRDALVRCGYPPCPGDYMASNPRWRQPLSSWKNYFRTWITEADLHSVEDALIFFDMRPVGGDASLFDALAASVREALREASFFKSVFAYITNDRKPPLGFFRTFVVEQSGQHKQELDIKTFGTCPIVNAARLLAIDGRIAATNTVDRLAAAQALPYLDDVLRRDLLESFELLTLLRLEHQLAQAHAAQPLSNYVNPGSLTQLQRSLLKEAFRTITRAQSTISDRFRSAVWAQLGSS